MLLRGKNQVLLNLHLPEGLAWPLAHFHCPQEGLDGGVKTSLVKTEEPHDIQDMVAGSSFGLLGVLLCSQEFRKCPEGIYVTLMDAV